MNIARIIQRLRPKTARSDTGISLAPPQAIRPDTDHFQRIVAPNPEQRMEGVAFSGDGQTLAVALSDTNRVYLYRRKPGSMAFEEQPCCRLEGASSGLDYPHDLAFSPTGDLELLAVAQRSGSILIFRNSGRPGQYDPEPAYRIQGRQTGLQYSDGVAFLPPRGDCLAACNLTTDRVTFYRRTARAEGTEFEARPCFTMQRKGMAMPDGQKGAAVHDDPLAVCRPETYLSLYTIEESGDGLSLQ